MIACGIQKLSPAQQKKLAKGLPVRVKSGSAHQVPLSPLQAKKLERAKKDNKGMILSIPPSVGGSLWGDAQNWYQTSVPDKYKPAIESLATMAGQDLGIIGSGLAKYQRGKKRGGSLWGDAVNWYNTTVPDKYKPAIESLVTMGAQDLGIVGSGVIQRKHGGSLFSEAKNWYESNIPAKYRKPIEQLAILGLQDAGVPVKGQGLFEDMFNIPTTRELVNFPKDFVKGLELVPTALNRVENVVKRDLKPLRGKGHLAILAKHPVAGRHHLVRHHMLGAGKGRKISGAGWQEDLSAFNQWTDTLGNKLTSIAHSVDPEGRLQEAGINAIVDYLAPEMRAIRVAEQQANALAGKPNAYRNKPKSEPAPETKQEKLTEIKKKKGRPQQGKKKQPVVTATEVPASENDKNERVLTAYTQPLPVASIASAFEEQLPYQPVRWFGSGLKKGTASTKAQMDKIRGVKLVKGSQQAKDYMAKLRQMRSKKMSGTSLFPAGMSAGALYPGGYSARDV
jgi:hypothetical protein